MKTKKIYLLFIIAISITIIFAYPTYAMFYGSVSSGTTINLDTNLIYDFDINSIKYFNIEANTTFHFNAKINNNVSDTIKYGIYHDLNLSNYPNVSIGEIVENATTTTIAPNTTGNVDPGNNKIVPIAIKNTSLSNITIGIGITTNTTSNELIYGGNYLISNTIDNDNITAVACKSNTNLSNCIVEENSGTIYKYCEVPN